VLALELLHRLLALEAASLSFYFLISFFST
jgi:hypothetical protein